MTYDASDTIVAIATSPAGAARGIVRASGPDCLRVVGACFRGPSLGSVRSPSALAGAALLGQRLGDVPCTLYLWPTKSSYTRQVSAEFHTIGSPPLLAALLDRLCENGARLARPGEFTLRAFLAGRLDLTQAEAVLGVIEARGQRDLEAALAQLAGGLAAPLARLRGGLLDLLADLEAGLDFVDEDIEFVSRGELLARLQAAAEEVAALGEKLRSRDASAGEAPRVALIGEPNAGKSSLFNALAGENRAIVSPVAGTTRDYLAAIVDCAGVQVELLDTAGVEEVGDSGQGTGNSRSDARELAQGMTRRESEAAQIVLVCLDSTRPPTPRERSWLAESAGPTRLLVSTKTDAPGRRETPSQAIATSATTGAGLSELRKAIARALSTAGATIGAAARCRESFSRADEALARAIEVARSSSGDEFLAAELRLALNELAQVAGAVYTDDVLDRIFSRFCIGK